MQEMMDKLQHFIHQAVELESAEQAKAPYQTQIDAFMQQKGELNEEAQAAFEDWAAQRISVMTAARRVGIKPQPHWNACDYNAAATQMMAAMTPYP